MEPKFRLAHRTYAYWPEDLLEALDMLLAYLVPRASVRTPSVVPDNPHFKGNWRRCIYDWRRGGRWEGNIAWAYYVLNVNTRKKHWEGRTMWRLGARWRYRLGLAGIDPDTLEIVDQLRFNLAWEQLFEFNGKFYAQIQAQRIAQGRQAPAAVMRTDVKMKRVQGLPKPKRKKIVELAAEHDKAESPFTIWMRDRIKSRISQSS